MRAPVIIVDYYFLRSHLAAVGLVKTMASVCHCTRKTASHVFARKDSWERTAKQVRNFSIDLFAWRSKFKQLCVELCPYTL